jgi:branched-chain amino acid transport system ATP-binding protein
MDSLLRLNDVVVKYGKAQVLQGVSLEIEKGALATIIGSNGAGKTTILYSVFGLVSVASGEIWFSGTKISGLPPHRICALHIAMVFGGRRLFPYMTVRDNLLIGGHLCTSKKVLGERLDEIEMYFPRLKERLKQKAGSLSGGEQQMAAIGRALMADPVLLLLDEPSLGLSPIMVSELFGIIDRIHKDKKGTILLVEQNARMALSVASKGIVLQSGRIVLEDRGETLLKNEQVGKAYLGV